MFTSSSSTFSLFLCQPSVVIVFLSGGCIRSGLFCRSLLLSVHCCWCHPSHLFSFFGTDVGLLKAFVSIRLFCFPDCLAYWSVVFLYCLVVCFFSPFFFARCFDNNFEIVLLPWCCCRFLITCLILLTEFLILLDESVAFICRLKLFVVSLSSFHPRLFLFGFLVCLVFVLLGCLLLLFFFPLLTVSLIFSKLFCCHCAIALSHHLFSSTHRNFESYW